MTKNEANAYMKGRSGVYMYNIRKMIDELDPDTDALDIIRVYTMLKTLKDIREEETLRKQIKDMEK
ncbi:MAG: hypothetical protein PUC28_12885 [Blautia sp.]|nr:hypothetical protein [Blautia sp.]